MFFEKRRPVRTVATLCLILTSDKIKVTVYQGPSWDQSSCDTVPGTSLLQLGQQGLQTHRDDRGQELPWAWHARAAVLSRARNEDGAGPRAPLTGCKGTLCGSSVPQFSHQCNGDNLAPDGIGLLCRSHDVGPLALCRAVTWWPAGNGHYQLYYQLPLTRPHPRPFPFLIQSSPQVS